MNTENFRSDQAPIKTGHTEDVRLSNEAESTLVAFIPACNIAQASSTKNNILAVIIIDALS